VDLTLCDLVADHRAATPTMAAEMAVPVWEELRADLDDIARRLVREIQLCLSLARQDVDQATITLTNCLQGRLARERRTLADIRQLLERKHPRAQLVAMRGELRDWKGRADSAMRRRLDLAGRGLSEAGGRLQALSPLSVLERGYALATTGEHVLTDASDVKVGQDIDVQLARGRLAARVTGVKK
jgi:exodeoxyribonuclease VII large subunit